MLRPVCLSNRIFRAILDLFCWQGILDRHFLLNLVGGWTNPFEKYARQIGSLSPGVKKKNICETTNQPGIFLGVTKRTATFFRVPPARIPL